MLKTEVEKQRKFPRQLHRQECSTRQSTLLPLDSMSMAKSRPQIFYVSKLFGFIRSLQVLRSGRPICQPFCCEVYIVSNIGSKLRIVTEGLKRHLVLPLTWWAILFSCKLLANLWAYQSG